MNRRLLLLSNSTTYGYGYLDHAENEIKQFLKERKNVLFVPFALKNTLLYTKKVRDRFEKMNLNLKSIEEFENHENAFKYAEAIFVGGGNTFRLLNMLYEKNLIELIKKKVNRGLPYIGSSAGTNITSVNIKTTNDMPIIYPPSFDALNLVPFNINPHYIDADLSSTHKGETREERIKDFHDNNNNIVIGLYEGSMLLIEKNTIYIKGLKGVKIFRPDGSNNFIISPNQLDKF